MHFREKKREFGGSNLIGVDRCSYSLWDAHLLASCYRPLLLQSCLAAAVCLLVPGGDCPAICLCRRLACCRVQTCSASLYRLLQCCSPCNMLLFLSWLRLHGVRVSCYKDAHLQLHALQKSGPPCADAPGGDSSTPAKQLRLQRDLHRRSLSGCALGIGYCRIWVVSHRVV